MSALVVNVVAARDLTEGMRVPGLGVAHAVAPALHVGRMWVSVLRPDGTLAEAEVPGDWAIPVVVEAVDR